MADLASDATAQRWSGPRPLLLMPVALLVFASACGGLALSDAIGRVSAIWVSNAVLVYFLLTNSTRNWIGIFAAGLTANLLADVFMGDSFATSVALTLCNGVGVAIVAAPLKKFGLEKDFSRPKPLCIFYALALGPAPVISGLLSAVYFHFAAGRDFFAQSFDWYATDALGYSIVVPLLMTARIADFKKMFGREELVVTLLLLGVMLGTLAINFVGREYPIAFLFFPALILVTFQRGFAGGAIALLMAAAYMMIPIFVGDSHGALKQHSLRDQIILVQLFVAVMGFSVVLIGAALAERRRLEQGLAAAIVRTETSREEAVVARDSAERANRMKSMFLATMSHELRTPLNAILGFSQLMQQELYGAHGDPHYGEYSGLIHNAGTHLLSLINDVLDMSKIEAGKFELRREVFDVRDVIRDGLSLMRERAHQARVRIVDDVPSKPLQVEADIRAVKQILLNLLSNAIKFTPEGGWVFVRARMIGDDLVVSVEDTGIGIPADQLNRLGNPFVQVRSSAGSTHEGTGLGLALVRALAEIHGGKLKIESVLGRGTTVSISIPNSKFAETTAEPEFAKAS
jgi:signal transduction histidine kinase